jgi:putative hydrolase of the HAD superfamily
MSKPKVIICDADGMIIRAEMFSTRLAWEYNVAIEKILPFFEQEFLLCITGKADVKVELKKYLKKWKVKKNVDELLREWFEFENQVDRDLVDLVKKLRKKGLICVLATNQEKYRNRYLKDKMKFEEIFDLIFSSVEIGFKKPDWEFYDHIYERLQKVFPQLNKAEVLFFDDKEKNIVAAKNYGFRAEVYSEIDVFRKQLKELGLT